MHMTKSLPLLTITLILLVLIPAGVIGEDGPNQTEAVQSEDGNTSLALEELNTTTIVSNTTDVSDTKIEANNTDKKDPPDISENVTVNSSVQANNQTAGPTPDAMQKAYTGWYRKGVNASAAGNYQSASEAFAAALRLDKGSEEAQIGYAGALSRLGRDAEALEIFTRIHNLNPTNTSLLIPLGREQNAVGNYREAVDTLQNATIKYPGDPEGWNQLAAAYSGMYRYEEALTTVRRSLQLSLEQAGGWGELGAILSGQGRFYEAIAAFEKALTLDPKDATIWKGLGDTWSALSQYDEAAAAFESATEIRPTDTTLWIRLGDIYVKQGNITHANEAYEKGGRINQSETNATGTEDQVQTLNRTVSEQTKEIPGNTTEEVVLSTG